ncbi:MAG: lipopolysaccharide assembly protein LapB [Pseudomonadota bacterium]
MTQLLLLFVGLLAGVLLVYLLQYSRTDDKTQRQSLPRDYLQGLNFLLNEEPDKAVDHFIKMLEVDSDTVETHLALGNLFRRRGEVNRAIRIHQNLIARPSLTAEDRNEAMLALATDYLGAGVFDRAEKLFSKLVELKAYTPRSLGFLLDIYQQEKAWEKAINTAQKIALETGKSTQRQIAHYYCELAEIDIESGSTDNAYNYLKQALSVDKNCVRASLLLGELEYISGRHKHAIRIYRQAGEKNPNFISEVITLLSEAYQSLGEEDVLEQYIHEILRKYPQSPIILIIVEQFNNWCQDEVIVNALVDYVNKHPSMLGLHYLITLKMTKANPAEQAVLRLLHGVTEKLQSEHPRYKCEACGFSGKTMHWLCPSCKSWGEIRYSYLTEDK